MARIKCKTCGNNTYSLYYTFPRNTWKNIKKIKFCPKCDEIIILKENEAEKRVKINLV